MEVTLAQTHIHPYMWWMSELQISANANANANANAIMECEYECHVAPTVRYGPFINRVVYLLE